MKLGTIYLNGKIVPIVQGTEGKAFNLLEICKKLEISQIESILNLINLSRDNPNLLNNITNTTQELVGFDPIDWAPPVTNPSKILGVAFNNKELIKKAHKDPGVPNYFLKPPSALQAHEKPIIVDPDWGAVIPEPEICAVIGKRAKHISEEEALNYVFGYICLLYTSPSPRDRG